MANVLMVINPYWHNGTWVFDDESVGLDKEPFVAGVPEILDKMVRDMDRKWGVDRLPEIVSPETAAKYGSALAKLCAAIDEGEPEMIAARANVCMRGMAAMDGEALSLGRAPAELDNVWIMEFNGIEVGLMKDARHWPKIMDHHPGLELITENEVITALAFYRETQLGKMVNAVKQRSILVFISISLVNAIDCC